MSVESLHGSRTFMDGGTHQGLLKCLGRYILPSLIRRCPRRLVVEVIDFVPKIAVSHLLVPNLPRSRAVPSA